MSHMVMFVKKLVRGQEGATALEYGLIAALIAAVIIGSVTTLGTNINTTFSTIASRI